MLKILICLVIALCLLPIVGTAEAVTVYTSDFSRNTDGWYGRGGQCAVTAEGTLKTTGRSSDWNSPGRNFDLVEGGVYEISAEVKQDSVDSAQFVLSIAQSLYGNETYENLAFGNAGKGEWITLRGTYTAGNYEQTLGAPTLEYEIRYFTVMAPDGCQRRRRPSRPW